MVAKLLPIFLVVTVNYTAVAQILNVEKSRLSSDSANYFVGNVSLAVNSNNQSVNDDGETVFL